MKRFAVNGALVLGSFLLVFLVILGVDRIVGLFHRDVTLDAGLIFPPNVTAHYDSIEFTFSAEINSLGFRDKEYSLQKRDALRVLALGDSYTFGWGVPRDDAWVEIVEQTLNAQGHAVEILNLGAPGAAPDYYADVAERAVPLLKPDVVLVNLLQGDDLPQVDRGNVQNRTIPPATRAPSRKTLAQRLFPHLTALAQRTANVSRMARERRATWSQIDVDWKQRAQKMIEQMGEQERGRFERLDPAIQEAFLEGRVSPVAMLAVFMNLEEKEWRLDSEETQRQIAAGAEELRRIREIAEQHGARTIALIVVNSVHTSPFIREAFKDIVVTARPQDLTTTVPDDAIRAACDRAGIPVYSVTEEFRKIAQERPLFFDLDTHMTAEGNRVFAELVTPVLKSALYDSREP